MTIRHFKQNSVGATSIEYALIASLIAVVILGAVTALGGNVLGLFNTIANAIP